MRQCTQDQLSLSEDLVWTFVKWYIRNYVISSQYQTDNYNWVNGNPSHLPSKRQNLISIQILFRSLTKIAYYRYHNSLKFDIFIILVQSLVDKWLRQIELYLKLSQNRHLTFILINDHKGQTTGFLVGFLLAERVMRI